MTVPGSGRAAGPPETDRVIARMRALAEHARAHGGDLLPVFSPVDAIVDTHAPTLAAEGFPVVVWTVNDPGRMASLIDRGVDGIISDRPDLLHAVAERHAGPEGPLITGEGLVDRRLLDVQGHRGARGLRPENTLPAMEAGLDHLVTTLELDVGVTADGIAVLSHDPYLGPETCRRRDGAGDGVWEPVLIRDLRAAAIQERFVADRLAFGGRQTADRALSPVSRAFAARHGICDPYVVPTLAQTIAFLSFYAAWYDAGDGRLAVGAARRALNAAGVRLSIETKWVAGAGRDRRRSIARPRTRSPEAFVDAVGEPITAAGLEARTDLQSFDERTLRRAHVRLPGVRTVLLVGAASP